jgi:hypothetical protein
MRLVHVPRGRLAGTVLVGLALTLAVLVAAARGTTEAEGYYLALGDSIAYGVQPTKARPGARPSDFDTGYVDVLAARLRKLSPGLQVVNYGCPGESTVTFSRGGCPAFADRVKLHDAFRGSQLAAALAFLRAHPGEVSPISLTLFGNDWLPPRAGHLQGGGRLRPEARPRRNRSVRHAVCVHRPTASRGRARCRDRRDGRLEPGSRSARGPQADLSLARVVDRSSRHAVPRPRREDAAGLQSSREDGGTTLRAHLHLLEGRSPSDRRGVPRDRRCGAPGDAVAPERVSRRARRRPRHRG